MFFHRDIQTLLAPTGEAKALMLLLLEHEAGLSTAQVLMGEAEKLPQDFKADLAAKAQRVANGEPIQYVLGEAQFCDLPISVAPDVLIPRPETEELVRWAARQIEDASKLMEGETNVLRMLDLCTGSGCIALALKSLFPDAEVHGVDVSGNALKIACRNAKKLGLDVTFHQTDVLSFPLTFSRGSCSDGSCTISLEGCPSPTNEGNCADSRSSSWWSKAEDGRETVLETFGWGKFSLLISNPPYVCQCEAEQMDINVLEHEPHLALFVPDEDPLRFYQAITHHGQRLLKKGGLLMLELNPRFSDDVADLLRRSGYSDIIIRQDAFGKQRMISATWNHSENQ